MFRRRIRIARGLVVRFGQGLVRHAPVRLHRSLTGACHAHACGCARTKWRIGDYRVGRAKLLHAAIYIILYINTINKELSVDFVSLKIIV
jgi:hypothetical protein